MNGHSRSLRSLLLVVAVVAMIAWGPAWPSVTTELICGESFEVREVFRDMDACAARMPEGCFCSVRTSLFAPLVYLVFAPLGMIVAVSIVSIASGRGMAAVVGVVGLVLALPWPIMALYGAGIHIPRFFQPVAIVWPQLVFFGPTLYGTGSQPGPVIPHEWGYVATVVFWLAVAFAFGLLAKRVKAMWALTPLAIVFVVAIVIAVRWVMPMLGWQLLLEYP